MSGAFWGSVEEIGVTMDAQKLVALVIVAAAGVYLARLAWQSWKDFRAGRGCEEGCGKCAFAAPDRRPAAARCRRNPGVTLELTAVSAEKTKPGD